MTRKATSNPVIMHVNGRDGLRRLRDAGYQGPICIEAPRSGDREAYAREDLAYIRSVLRALDPGA